MEYQPFNKMRNVAKYNSVKDNKYLFKHIKGNNDNVIRREKRELDILIRMCEPDILIRIRELDILIRLISNGR